MVHGKLGRKAKVTDSRTLKLGRYLETQPLAPPPAEVSWVTKVPQFPMFLNDSLGDCVIAAMAHMIQQWSYYSSGGTAEVTVTNAQVLAAYERLGGYVPGDPTTDNGVVMLDALRYWKNTGFAGHRIQAYMTVNYKNLTEVFQAIQIFGNVFVGLNLPLTAQGENAWTVANGGPINNPDAAPGSWGGHCVPVMAGSPETLTCVTWGEKLKMSHNFFKDYAEEAFVILSPDWLSKLGESPSNFNLNQLVSDLAVL